MKWISIKTPSVRNMRDEYLRLETRTLPTIVTKTKLFCNSPYYLLIFNLNVQSLNAHRKDIAGDPVLPLADYYLL